MLTAANRLLELIRPEPKIDPVSAAIEVGMGISHAPIQGEHMNAAHQARLGMPKNATMLEIGIAMGVAMTLSAAQA